MSHVVGESIMSVCLLHAADAGSAMVGLDGDILGDDASAALAAAAFCRVVAFGASDATERKVVGGSTPELRRFAAYGAVPTLRR